MFSLLDEPWIKAVDAEGNQVVIGIRDVFDGSNEISFIQGDSPAQNYAVTRLLLAIFWRAHHPDTEVDPGEAFDHAEWFEDLRDQLQDSGKDDAVLGYLKNYADHFDLVGAKHPFMQVADLHVSSGEIKHVSTIVPESQDPYFSMRAGIERDSLSLAEAARWLVYVQAYDYSGIKSGAVGDSRVKGGKGYPIGTGWSGMTGGTLVVGENLLDTLILNTPKEALLSVEDRPVWERNPYGPDKRSTVGESPFPQGAADLATWQSRRVRLHVEDDRVCGVVVSNGDGIPDAGANAFGDPMTPYRYSTNKSKKGKDVYYPRPYDVDRTMWKAFDALVVAETDGGFSGKDKAPKRPKILDNLALLAQEVEVVPPVLNLELVSIEYGPQASSVATTYASQMSLPVIVLMEGSEDLRIQVREAAAVTTKAAVALGQFVGNLGLAAGGDYEFGSAATDRALAELEPQFNTWLRRLADLTAEQASTPNESLGERMANWQKTVRDVIDVQAKIALRGAGPRAFVGRVLDQSEESKGRVVSAYDYYQRLQRTLDKNLPRTCRDKGKINQNEMKENAS
ncbi:type I-E CRISPR-associated protein Cse1/CasA [Trueperella pyogenes]|uniref:type I-E CRISPR-associated protein Cse1/CasA n=1 Tax=Trueperella pyogenes TaxID=1661 RepID=UPI000F858AB9|nr:type I-E CRISPR-associated protein Cse1/CasA [Trueperella pyogenes]AZQ99864.1 type I-E CRISPR-associated protein Cse1/CasA [Trueperella pyogenes]AZR02903.1 type I-E CRISPR-associated protein Cse1/CasA [Trueperella pyogenes]WHU58837.1 type I-E CRISPR-associated protein Cse1/CasA [Trueperella pyogenes]